MILIAGIIICGVLVFSIFVLPAFLAPTEPPTQITSRYINGTPQIDGLREALWLSNATIVEPILRPGTPGETNIGTEMYVMNNDSYLFFGIFLPNKIYQSSALDELCIYCDANFDGSMDNDDMKWLKLHTNIYKDCWLDIIGSAVYIYQDAVQNGYMTYTHSNPVLGERGDYFFEIAMPFNTTLTDPSELNRTRGDSIILTIVGSIYLGSGSAYGIQWPFSGRQFQPWTFGTIILG